MTVRNGLDCMDLSTFEHHIREAFSAIPPDLREKIHNVAFVVEVQERSVHGPGHDIRLHRVLLGLYEGVPLLRRSAGYTNVLPDKITIFMAPIVALGHGDPAEIRKIVHEVVHHEVGHYFGMGEAEVRAWERQRKQRGGD